MPTAVILDAVRSARGKRKGSLASIHPVDLAAHVLRAALARLTIPAEAVDDVVLGCVTQVGEQGLNVARGAVLAAGLPIGLAAKTVNRLCGSGLQAVDDAACEVLAGRAEVAIGGGVESMSRVPLGSDYLGGEGPTSPGLARECPGLVPQGLSAELVARAYQLSRAQLDEYSAASQAKAALAQAEGRFLKEIVPVPVHGPDGTEVQFVQDEHLRPGTTVQTLAALKPAFREDGLLHAGSSSGLVDGAAAVVVASSDAAKRFGIRPRARIVTCAVAGSDPVLMLTGPIPSTRKALARAKWRVEDVDLWEINEAFAPVPIAVAQELGIPLERVNVNGGAIALGHPLGATGAMLLATLLSELERRELRRGAVTLCIGYGMGITLLVDRVLE